MRLYFKKPPLVSWAAWFEADVPLWSASGVEVTLIVPWLGWAGAGLGWAGAGLGWAGAGLRGREVG